MKKTEIIISIIFCLALIAVSAAFASSNPDGLEWAAEKLKFEAGAPGIVSFKFLMPDYSVPGINSSFWSTVISGAFGLGAVYLLTLVVSKSIFRKR